MSNLIVFKSSWRLFIQPQISFALTKLACKWHSLSSSLLLLLLVVESACYCGSNKALTWGDIDFYLIPDDGDPAHPSLVVDIQLNLVKGFCKMDHRYQKLLFTLELRKEHRITCIVLPLPGLAFHDSVFAHSYSIESLLCPEKPPTTQVNILLQNEVLTLPLLQKEEKGGDGKISKTEAFSYDGLLHYLNILSHLRPITLYDFHASQENKADVDLGKTARKTLMLHDPNSKNKYKSKTITADLSAVTNRRGQDENRITLFWTAVAASLLRSCTPCNCAKATRCLSAEDEWDSSEVINNTAATPSVPRDRE
ncbi:hypothetical protein F5051DRAFT_443272 [Lentinula edodes]|nr:hypothetical protein F5051DRAFT_443272 [Lentinula edodes]KAJ3887611.1 hypothetical protein GG344DRAFT_80583 [Lentinula edodes]